MSHSLKSFNQFKGLEVWKGIFQPLCICRWITVLAHINLQSLLRNSSLKISVWNKFLSSIMVNVFLTKTSLNAVPQPWEGAPTSWLQNSPSPQQREEPWHLFEAAWYLQFSHCSATAGHPGAFAAPLLFLPGLGLHLRGWSTEEEFIKWKLSCTC